MISLEHIRQILLDRSPATLEKLAGKAAQLTQQYFGRTIGLYAPLYLSNYCGSYCTYCGFHSHNRIKRFKLTPEEMRQEMAYLANQGIENILLLTGESYQLTPMEYLQEAVGIANDYFSSISLEVHPLETGQYAQLFAGGVDGIAVYQETYDRKLYSQVHRSGIKADYDFRYRAPQRAAGGGIRSITLGILLGLADPAEDLCSLYQHLRLMEKNYPGVEYSLSFPRLKPIKAKDFVKASVDDATFIKIICLTRVLFPRVGINLSTRERPWIRDHVLGLGVTRLSAGSNTSVGGYTLKAVDEQDPQFDIEDHRSLAQIIAVIKKSHFDPILTDWRRIKNPSALYSSWQKG